ncbi:MAG: hypothetical protein ACRDP4_12300 [Nocardioidaceae bacterium]
MGDTPVRARLDDHASTERLARIDELIERVEQVSGPTTDAAVETVQALSEVYGEALARVLDSADSMLIDKLAGDELVRHLLVLHDLHPDSDDDAGPPNQSQEGQAELDEIQALLGRQPPGSHMTSRPPASTD